MAKVFIHLKLEDDRHYTLVSYYCASHCNLPENWCINMRNKSLEPEVFSGVIYLKFKVQQRSV